MLSKTLSIVGAVLMASLFTGCDTLIVDSDPGYHHRGGVYVVEDRAPTRYRTREYDRREYRDRREYHHTTIVKPSRRDDRYYRDDHRSYDRKPSRDKNDKRDNRDKRDKKDRKDKGKRDRDDDKRNWRQ